MYLNLNYLTSENVAKDTSEYIVTVVVVKEEISFKSNIFILRTDVHVCISTCSF